MVLESTIFLLVFLFLHAAGIFSGKALTSRYKEAPDANDRRVCKGKI